MPPHTHTHKYTDILVPKTLDDVVGTYLIGGPQVNPTVQHLRFANLLPFALIEKTHSKIPVYAEGAHKQSLGLIT